MTFYQHPRAAVLTACLAFGLFVSFTASLLAPSTAQAASLSAETCPAAGQWLEPDSGQVIAAPGLFQQLAGKKVVLLGEEHDSAEDHRWQLFTLAGLGALRPLAVGFEMLPRGSQPALDRWTRGELDALAFLKAARWREVWGYDAGLYLPLFHYLRQNRLPGAALNVERALVSRVGREGWSAIPLEEREGLGDPAPASAAYRERLAKVYADSAAHRGGGSLPLAEPVEEGEDFQRFVEAQLTWDRAMAEGLAALRLSDPDRLVIGIIGRGHLESGQGVPAQLLDLGFARGEIAVLLPLRRAAACDPQEPLAAALAEAVFLLGEEAPPPAEVAAGKPRLGVMIEATDGGVRVAQVSPDSVAADAGLMTGDLIVEAAGQALTESAALVEIVQRQAPGTWLPLQITRAGEALDLIAKFPAPEISAPGGQE